MPDWMIPTLTFIGGASLTWVLLRIRFERFEAMDTRREKDWSAWRTDVDDRLRDLNGSLLQRLKRVEEDIGTHDTGMQGMLNRLANRQVEMEARLASLERSHNFSQRRNPA